MDHRPMWLRDEWSYRTYVRGLRYALIGFLLAGAFGLLGSFVVAVPAVWFLALIALSAASVITGAVGWLSVPDKSRANLHQVPLLRMVAHDIVRGLPRSAGRANV